MKISVITVAYNSQKTITDTLDSVSNQIYKNIEHIVIDGASTDKTLKLIKNHSNINIRLLSEPDTGIFDAMNKGFIMASGEVIGFLNSDDIFSDCFALDKIATAFRDESVHACYGDLVYVNKDNSHVVRYWKSKPFSTGDFGKGWCPPHPTFYVRKSTIERLGLFDQSYKMGADVEFMMRYLERGNINAVYIPNTLVRMRIGGTSNQSWKNIFQQNQSIFLALKKNGIRFSVFRFSSNKMTNRLWQFIMGCFKRYK